MAIKNIIARGIGFSPGSVRFIVTHGFGPAGIVILISIKSLTAEDADVSLTAEDAGVSLSAEDDGISLAAEDDGVSLNAEDAGVSLVGETTEL